MLAETIVSVSVSGTPSAVPDSPPKLLRMSLRTTPLVASTLGPLDPSPGYGPSVSFGEKLHADATVDDRVTTST